MLVIFNVILYAKNNNDTISYSIEYSALKFSDFFYMLPHLSINKLPYLKWKLFVQIE